MSPRPFADPLCAELLAWVDPHEREALWRVAAAVAAALQRQVGMLPEGPMMLGLSGGLDSGLLAHLLRGRRDLVAATVIVDDATIRTEGADAAEVARLCDLPWEQVRVSAAQVIDVSNQVARLLGSTDAVVTAVGTVEWLLLEHRPMIPAVTLGQGADELFGGYARFGRMPSDMVPPALRSAISDLRKEGIERDRTIARRLQRQLHLPYLDARIDELCHGIPGHWAVPPSQPTLRKLPLRLAAALLGAPKGIVLRPKRAAQYGSGVDKVLRRATAARYSVHEGL